MENHNYIYLLYCLLLGSRSSRWFCKGTESIIEVSYLLLWCAWPCSMYTIGYQCSVQKVSESASILTYCLKQILYHGIYRRFEQRPVGSCVLIKHVSQLTLWGGIFIRMTSCGMVWMIGVVSWAIPLMVLVHVFVLMLYCMWMCVALPSVVGAWSVAMLQ